MRPQQINQITGSSTPSRDQVELQIRKANPYLDEQSIQNLINAQFSSDNKILQNRAHYENA